jgi:hypothetical protein
MHVCSAFFLEKKAGILCFLKKMQFFTSFFNFKSNLCLNNAIKINFSLIMMLTAILVLYRNTDSDTDK